MRQPRWLKQMQNFKLPILMGCWNKSMSSWQHGGRSKMRIKIRTLHKGLGLVSAFLVLASFVSACANDRNEDISYSVSIPMNVSPIGLSEHGMLSVIDEVLWFQDFESGNKVVLCNKPDCDHEPASHMNNPDPYCNAVLPLENKFRAVAIYDGFVYIFAEEKFNQSILFREKPDGSGREIVSRFDWSVSSFPFNQVYFKDSYAYFVGLKTDFNEQGTSDGEKYAIMR